MAKLDLNSYGISNTIVKRKSHSIHDAFGEILNVETKLNPFNRYGGLTRNTIEIQVRYQLKRLKNTGYKPEIIILEWTQISLLLPRIRDVYPDSKYVVIEEDVAFQGLLRKYKISGSNFDKRRANNEKNAEIEVLNNADLIVVNNNKDAMLINDEDISTEVICCSPFYHQYFEIENDASSSKEIIFFGAMSRVENQDAALWFLNNVMPIIEPLGFRFTVIGNKPPRGLTELQTNSFTCTGFVKSIEPFMTNSLCMVVPLNLGAGIKIKVLEAMSAGIPVLTNSIGIEGIPAKAMTEYLHCETPDEYVETICDLYSSPKMRRKISALSKSFIRKHFSFEDDCNRLMDRLSVLANS